MLLPKRSETGETSVSRIWDALKEAEQERTRGTRRKGDESFDKSSEGSSGKKLSERRRSQREVLRVPVLIYGRDAEQQPFHEEAYTLEVSESGSLMSLEATVACGQRLFLVNMRNQAEEECRVVTVGKRVRGKARVAIQFCGPAPHFWRR